MGEREVDEFPVGSLGWAKVEGTVQRQLEKWLCLLIEQVLVRRQCHLQMLNDSDTDRSRANENWAEGNDDREWETIEMNYKWQWHPLRTDGAPFIIIIISARAESIVIRIHPRFEFWKPTTYIRRTAMVGPNEGAVEGHVRVEMPPGMILLNINAPPLPCSKWSSSS